MQVSMIIMNPMILEGHWDELDNAGFEALYVVDHPYMDTPDPWPMLAYVAALTERIKLGTHVTAAPMHHPTELASAVATADMVSKGRVRFGIGTGYNHSDFLPFGFGSRPPMRERLSRMDEMIQVMKKLWSGEPVEFQGDYFEFTGGKLTNPKTIQDPHPPVIIGVNIPGKALDIAVREADEINTWQLGANAVSELGKAAAERCTQAGRDPSSLRLTSDVLLLPDGDEQAALEMVQAIRDGARTGGRHVQATQWDSGGVLYGDAAQMMKQAHKFADVGVEELTVNISSPEQMNWFSAEVLPGI